MGKPQRGLVIWCFLEIENPRKMNSTTSVKFFFCILVHRWVIKRKIPIRIGLYNRRQIIAELSPVPFFMTSKLMFNTLAHKKIKLLCLSGAYTYEYYHCGGNYVLCMEKASEQMFISHISYLHLEREQRSKERVMLCISISNDIYHLNQTESTRGLLVKCMSRKP